MDCQDFARQLDDWLDGALPPGPVGVMQDHERSCPPCAGTANSARSLARGLRGLPPPPPMRAGFAAAALRRARRANPGTPHRQPRRDAAFALAGAMAAGLGMAAVIWTRPPAAPGPAASPVASIDLLPLPELQTVTLSAGQVESLRMRIDAPRDLDNVHFSVELPDQVWLAEQPGIRAITWSGQLVAGQNLLELPLMAVAGADGTVVARVTWGEREQRLQTRVISIETDLGPLPAAPPDLGLDT